AWSGTVRTLGCPLSQGRLLRCCFHAEGLNPSRCRAPEGKPFHFDVQRGCQFLPRFRGPRFRAEWRFQPAAERKAEGPAPQAPKDQYLSSPSNDPENGFVQFPDIVREFRVLA